MGARMPLALAREAHRSRFFELQGAARRMKGDYRGAMTGKR
jgi:hypothetical protein